MNQMEGVIPRLEICLAVLGGRLDRFKSFESARLSLLSCQDVGFGVFRWQHPACLQGLSVMVGSVAACAHAYLR